MKTVLYPVLSVLCAAIVSVAAYFGEVEAFRHLLAMPLYLSVPLLIVGIAIAIVVCGIFALPTIYFTRNLPACSTARKLSLNLPVIIYFFGAVFAFVAIFTHPATFSTANWTVAIFSAIAVTAVSLRVSFLPIIMESALKQQT